MTSTSIDKRERVRGNILPAMLVLLGALTLLALGTTQSSLLELMMSSNELYRLRAFAAAEAGIAAAQAALASTAAARLPDARTRIPIPGMSDDNYDFTVRDGGEDARFFELSDGQRRARHFTIAATGRSLRSAQARVERGVRAIQDASGTLLSIESEFWLRKDVD